MPYLPCNLPAHVSGAILPINVPLLWIREARWALGRIHPTLQKWSAPAGPTPVYVGV
jgi:hypothetical protein